jgi:hypothetical protein
MLSWRVIDGVMNKVEVFHLSEPVDTPPKADQVSTIPFM